MRVSRRGWGRRTAPTARVAPIWRLAAVGALLVLGSLALTGRAAAHAYLDGAEPSPGSTLAQAPSQLRLTFSEAVDPSFSRVQVLDSSRQQVDRGDSHVESGNPLVLVVSLKDGLSDGLYTVSWRTLSAVDGHDATGAYQLVVGAVPAGAPAVAGASEESSVSPGPAVARWWLYLAGGALFGVLLAWRWVFARLAAPARQAALEPANTLAELASMALVGGVLFGAVAQAAVAAGGTASGDFVEPLVGLLGGGRYAAIWWPRLSLAVLALSLVTWGGVGGRIGDLALVTVAGVFLTSSLASHGAGLASGAYLAVAADWLHFLAAAAWVGGLASLALVLPRAQGAVPRQAPEVRGIALRRFSRLAVASIATIAVTGTFLAWLQVGSWQALVETVYGLSVTAKVLLMCGMVALAATQIRISRPGLAAHLGARAQALGRWTRPALQLELTLGVVVLAVAAFLAGSVPGREELALRLAEASQGGPVDRQIDADGLGVRVGINPASVGENHLSVAIPSADSSKVERVQLTLSYLGADLGSQPVVLAPDPGAPRTWAADTTALSQPGPWQAELLVRRAGQDDARSALRFAVAGPGAAPAGEARAAAYPLLPAPVTSLGYGLLALGAGVALWGVLRGGRGNAAQRARASVVGAGLVTALAGGYVYAQALASGAPLDVANVRDPIPPNAESLADGRFVYQQHCAVCHGDDGRGDGPAAVRLVPRPADFRVHMAAGHTDGQLFYWVSSGVPGSAMPAWKDTLSEQQRWDVINYIRTFAEQPGQAQVPPPSLAPLAGLSDAGNSGPAGQRADAAGGWVTVARWQDSQIQTSAPFTVRGPWRIRWRVAPTDQPLQLMVDREVPAGASLETPELLTAPSGQTEGVFDEADGGTYTLMFHSEQPYEVEVEDRAGP